MCVCVCVCVYVCNISASARLHVCRLVYIMTVEIIYNCVLLCVSCVLKGETGLDDVVVAASQGAH